VGCTFQNRLIGYINQLPHKLIDHNTHLRHAEVPAAHATAHFWHILPRKGGIREAILAV
jgi:hypothetical protein